MTIALSTMVTMTIIVRVQWSGLLSSSFDASCLMSLPPAGAAVAGNAIVLGSVVVDILSSEYRRSTGTANRSCDEHVREKGAVLNQESMDGLHGTQSEHFDVLIVSQDKNEIRRFIGSS